MYLKIIAFGVMLLVIRPPVKGQKTHFQLAQDTIVTQKNFPGNYYLMNGRKLTLPVMQWLMTDYPEANTEIRLAVAADNLSIGGYVFGGVFIFGGFLVSQEDQNLGKTMYTLGGIGIGTGILLHIISANFQRKAVHAYNKGVKDRHYRASPNVNLGISNQGITIYFGF